ncbi:MAG: hypothetical protein ABI253_13150 [Mycobacterium sp.]
MAFVITNRIPPIDGSAVRRPGRRVVDRLRDLIAPLEMSPQHRAERYVARMPTAVLGAC